MKPTNEIQKAMHDTVEVISTQVQNAVMQYINNAGAKGVTREDLPKLIALVRSTADQGYHNSAKNFERVVNRVITQVADEAAGLEPDPFKKK